MRSSSGWRSPRSTRPISRGRRVRPPSSTPGATASASCAPSSSSIAPSGRCRSSPRIGTALAIASVGFAIPIVVTYVETGLVPRLPTAVLSTGLMMLAFLSLAVGLVLDTVTRGRREMKLLAYLAHRAPGEERRRGLNVKELVRTNDLVLVSAVVALLDGAGIPHMVLDQNMSVLEGSLGILPRRVLVAEDYCAAARRLLHDAGLGHELRPDAR